ncbi:AEC family transporter [Persephonella sp.]
MLESLFSVILFFVSGYISRKLRIFDERSADTLIKFIIYFAFPALVIYNVYYLDIKRSFILVILGGWLVIIFSIAVSYIAGRLMRLNRVTLASFMMMASFGNTSFLGFPFQLALLGEDGLRYAVVFDQLASFLPVSLISPFILSFGQSSEKVGIDIKKVVTFPPFIALLGAFLIKNIHIPEFVLGSLKMLGMTVIPLALFSVGINLRFSKVKDRMKDIIAVISIKMLLVPVLTVLILYVFSVNASTEWLSFIIEISMPPMVLASILVIGAGLDRDLAVSSVGIGIIISFITVPLMVYITKNLL